MNNKIVIPPNRDRVKEWVVEHYGDNFTISYLDDIVDRYMNSVDSHTMYSKKKLHKIYW